MLNVANPITLILLLLFTIFFVIVAKATKKSFIIIIVLLMFIVFLVVHTVSIIGVPAEDHGEKSRLYACIAIDFIYIFINFMSFLWVDDIQTRFNNAKSLDNSLDWFWKNL